ncbi:DUF6388 family protein [Pseudomonas sp. NFIX28]|uniref:DUF6388 family protein n=1 Tax=Pseudomonas sp. NFIX28 TaxID=1566235 RepID=UPI00089C4B4D|nr:DUF6388 family protein [Pseudomonas sp. NFIX28]SDZ51701.1 hypothetical protein SAMN03159453_04295 [Pseudomonas sp. NFIX28]
MAALEQPHEVALQKFLASHPEIRQELDHLNPLAARARGETPEHYRAQRLHEAFEAEAERLGLFAWELSLQLTVQNAEEFAARRLDVHREVAQMAGMPWDEYCELHGLPRD